MRLLTLVRHAKSSWAHPQLQDFDRPLNTRGQRDAPRMAEHALRALGRPDRIVCSPAVRALSTAHVFAERFGIAPDELQHDPRIYEASSDALLRVVHEFDDGDRHVMMFGHNPGFSELAHRLARCGFDDLPTCAIVQIGFRDKLWCEIDERCGVQRFYAYPKQLRERT